MPCLVAIVSTAQILLAEIPPPGAYLRPGDAVDHVVEMEQVDDQGRKTTVIFKRSGPWLVEERGGFPTTYSNYQTGISYTVLLGGAGDARGIVGIAARRSPLDHPKSSDLWRQTDKRDSGLQETCVVWKRDSPIASGQLSKEVCETADGIPLWSRVYSSGGDQIAETKAARIERISLSMRDVSPPPEFLDWTFWKARADIAPSLFELAPPEGDYEIVYQVERMGLVQPDNITSLRSGYWTQDTTYNGTLVIEHPAMKLEVRVHRGFPTSLTIVGQAPVTISGTPRKPRIAKTGQPDETILGETCQWFTLNPRRSLHYARSECRTQDQIALKVTEYIRTPDIVRQAVSLSRAPVDEGDIAPPAFMIDWAKFP